MCSFEVYYDNVAQKLREWEEGNYLKNSPPFEGPTMH